MERPEPRMFDPPVAQRTSTALAPSSAAARTPAMSPSYSATLFVATGDSRSASLRSPASAALRLLAFPLTPHHPHQVGASSERRPRGLHPQEVPDANRSRGVRVGDRDDHASDRGRSGVLVTATSPHCVTGQSEDSVTGPDDHPCNATSVTLRWS
jgi:hypothetical protein